MNNVSQLSVQSFSTPIRETFSKLSNRYVLAALTALALVAVAYLALRTFAPHTLSHFSIRPQQPTSTSAIPTSIEECSAEARSEALLAGLLPTTLLQDRNEKLKLIAQARAFAATVKQESDLDARAPTVRGNVPEITALANNDWYSLPVGQDWYRIEKPIEPESGSAGGYPVQFASSEGPRSEMEDEHVATTLNYPGAAGPIGLVGVFDGHGGVLASKYMKDHIEEYLSEEIQANIANFPVENFDDLYAGCILALHNAIIKIDEAFSRETDPITKQPLEDGTTAIVGLIVHDKVIVANIGDCRAILIRHGQPIPMTVDAEPQIKRYREQVEALGGQIHFNNPLWRVEGRVATPAAVGDHKIVPHTNSIAGRKCIINVPEISIFDYEPGDKIIMACDGLWDALSINKVTEIVTQRPKPDVVPVEISDAVLLTRQALLTRGQSDNVTVAIVDLIDR